MRAYGTLREPAPTPILRVIYRFVELVLGIFCRIGRAMSRKTHTIGPLLAAGFLAGCTTNNPEALAQHDPFEPMNRSFFNFTQKADKYVAKPVAKGYIAVVPQPARDGIHNI